LFGLLGCLLSEPEQPEQAEQRMVVCKACSSPNRDEIDRRLSRGEPLRKVLAWLRSLGLDLSVSSLSNHHNKHRLRAVPAPTPLVRGEVLPPVPPPKKGTPARREEVLVAEKALRLGDLGPEARLEALCEYSAEVAIALLGPKGERASSLSMSEAYLAAKALSEARTLSLELLKANKNKGGKRVVREDLKALSLDQLRTRIEEIQRTIDAARSANGL
jgi:hypothetical protein